MEAQVYYIGSWKATKVVARKFRVQNSVEELESPDFEAFALGNPAKREIAGLQFPK